MLDDYLRREFGSVVSSLFDPAPIQFRSRDERGVPPVRRACQASDDGISRLRTALNRNAFLCGCLGFTERDRLEHLIVGFGNKSGSTTKVTEVAHILGQQTRVDFPAWLGSRLGQWLRSGHKCEAIVFHNHPPNDLNAAIDNAPLASSTDRRTLLKHFLQPFAALKGLTGGGRLRFYVGENGYVREFRTPDVLALLAMSQQPSGAGRRPS